MKKEHWLITGPKISWENAFEHNGIWAVKEYLFAEWKALEKRDVIFFYVTSPISGVVGIGIVNTKFVKNKPFWPDEIEEGRLIYPYAFEFDIDYLLEIGSWKNKRIQIGAEISEIRRGINHLKQRTVSEIYMSFKDELGYDISSVEKENDVLIGLDSPVQDENSLNHTNIKELIFKIGRMNRLISEKEYPMENQRLDVVWRRVERSVPTYVFEIQVGGDIFHALAKLKHAFDIWNSNIFLVTREKDMGKAEELLSGTFHEIKDRIKKISIKKTNELYQQKSRWIELEKEIGLL